LENTYQLQLWQNLAETCIKNLKKHGFDAHFVSTKDQAREVILEMVSDYETFGFGGSDTVRALDVPEALQAKGKTIYDHWQKDLSEKDVFDYRLLQGRCDCFFCSANAISATGEIVNVDGIGNRNSAMTFGPNKVVIVAGMNKVMTDLDSALKRVRDIAAPMRALSLGMETPCAATGVCNDCDTPQRLCRITTILHRKPILTDVSVILINQTLGF
jgi:L-lactate utilization protein LutB